MNKKYLTKDQTQQILDELQNYLKATNMHIRHIDGGFEFQENYAQYDELICEKFIKQALFIDMFNTQDFFAFCHHMLEVIPDSSITAKFLLEKEPNMAYNIYPEFLKVVMQLLKHHEDGYFTFMVRPELYNNRLSYKELTDDLKLMNKQSYREKAIEYFLSTTLWENNASIQKSLSDIVQSYIHNTEKFKPYFPLIAIPEDKKIIKSSCILEVLQLTVNPIELYALNQDKSYSSHDVWTILNHIGNVLHLNAKDIGINKLLVDTDKNLLTFSFIGHHLNEQFLSTLIETFINTRLEINESEPIDHSFVEKLFDDVLISAQRNVLAQQLEQELPSSVASIKRKKV